MTQMDTDKDSRTHAIIGAAIEVHNHLGHGFLEPVYQHALSMEFELRDIVFKREVELPVHYKKRILPCAYRADFVCFDGIIVEIKALGQIRGPEQAQVINYLKGTGFSLGLLLNFGSSRLEYKRLILSHNLRPSASSADDIQLRPQRS